MARTSRRWVAAAGWVGALAHLGAGPAAGTFHLMQIEQVIGGVCGRIDQQAVQLRMREDSQHFVSGKTVVARDAAGNNPVTLDTFGSNVSSTTNVGSRILVATAAFTAAGNGPAPDFVMDPIPVAYLLAGKVNFAGVWSLAWGGAAYTGTNTATMDNDADGNFNPAFGGVLRWTTGQALLFQGTATASSTNNADNYLYTVGDSLWVNAAGDSVAVAAGCVFGDGFETNGFQGWDLTVTGEP
jgi:hypothetical protein